MKLSFSPLSPFARKVRIAAIELGLIDRIEFVAAKVVPGEPNDAYVKDVNPLKKLPALILDNGEVIVDSYVIAEYLDELAGGGKLIPASGPDKVAGEERAFAAAGHHRLDAAVPLRIAGAAGAAIAGRPGTTIIGRGSGPAGPNSRPRATR